MPEPRPAGSSEPGTIEGIPAYDHLLEVRSLRTFFFTPRGVVKAVDDVSFCLDEGRILGLVGESGCGKSVTALSLLRLVGPPGRMVGGSVLYKGRDLMSLPEETLRKLRGSAISMIFQEPGAALNPVLTVGFQIAEVAMVHKGLRKREAMAEAVRMLEEVRIPDAARRAREYPHQMSGGMKQRVMIAMALVCEPAILIADEPTTALDVTIQAQILDLLAGLREKYRLSILLITHDLGVVAEVADRVAVMYTGKIVEEASVRDLFREPRHPYTQGLLRSIPRGGQDLRPERRLPAIEGMVPDPLAPPRGCLFEPRCPDCFEACTALHPPLLPTAGPPTRGPAAARLQGMRATERTPLVSDTNFRKVACYQFEPPHEETPRPDGSGWDPVRGR